MSSEPGSGGVELSRIIAGKAHAPVVYFVRVGDNVKIGTTTNLKGRMQSLYLSLEDVVLVVPGGKDVEAAYHERFTECRIHGEGRRELFRLSRQLRSLLSPQRPAVPDPAAPDAGKPLVTLREACDAGVLGSTLAAARKAAQRPGFPKATGWAEDGRSALYHWAELMEYRNGKVRAVR